MDNAIKIVTSKIKELDPLALATYQYYLNTGAVNGILYSLDELFIVIDQNIEKLSDKNHLNIFLQIFHYTITKGVKDIEKDLQQTINFINHITEKYEENYKSVIFELLHQYLVSLATFGKISIKNVPQFKIIDVYSENKEIRLRSRICLELMINIFSNIEILTKILKDDHIYFEELFTHFVIILLKDKKLYKDEKFWLICFRNLLTDNRKFGIYWIKSAVEQIESFESEDFEIPNLFKWTTLESSKIVSSWCLFLAILQSLDNKQSHLILPSLEILKTNTMFGIWNEFILCEIMKHTNTLVLKWATNFILSRFTCDDFKNLDKYVKKDQNSLYIILQGFNNTFLYTGVECLRPQNFKKFINKNLKEFFTVFVNIDWKSIPLDILMHSLDDTIFWSTTSKDNEINFENNTIKEDLFKLAGKIRRIENKIIRTNIRRTFFTKFKSEVNYLEAENFLKLLELLFNENEEKSDYDVILIENKLKDMNVKNINISFELLKVWLELHYRLDSCINKKILCYFISNCSLEVILKTLHLMTYPFENKICKVFEDKIQSLNENDDKKFIQNYLKLLTLSPEDNTIKDAFNFVISDLKGIGKSELQSVISFSILKQKFVDEISRSIFFIYEKKLSQVENLKGNTNIEVLLTEYFSISESMKLDIDLEMLINKGSFEILNYFLKNENLPKIFLCCNFETKTKVLNLKLLKRILLEISTNSKTHNYKNVTEALTRIICVISPQFPDVLNYILDFEEKNFEFVYIVFSTVLENSKDLNLTLKHFYSSESGLDFLIRGLLYGEPLLGEPRMEYEYLIENNLINFAVTSSKIRNLAVKLLQYLVRDVFTIKTVVLLRDKLLLKSENLNNRKSRYFKNSKQHRIKLRIVQSLAIISSGGILQKEIEWTDRYLIPIIQENNQTDVTYIMELLIANTIPISKIIEMLKNGSNLSNSGIISLFAITFIACFNYVDRNELEVIRQIIKLILPWTMGQNFHIRLYAQISIYHLIKHFKLNDYSIMCDSILESLKQGTAEKNYKKLNHDFRFHLPNLKELLKFDIIYYCIPLLNRTDVDEWYNTELQNDCKISIFKEFYEEMETQLCKKLVTIDVGNVQRKINPFVLEDVKFSSFLDNFEENKEMEIDMIVIASLIDKLPNLGGIARTCEVLGIKKLAVSSLKYAETKEFKGLSMTAEKWLNLFELKAADILDYLIKMKSNGYQIIGAEQTSNSENFINFKFPKKTILLLGHEKEGIPASLIVFLDYAVEIQQFGMVRSLNVHVTGALFIWEFCKQHIASK